MTSALARLPSQLLFGAGAIDALPGLVREHGRRPAICTDSNIVQAGIVDNVRSRLRPVFDSVPVYAEARPEVPISDVTSCAGFLADHVVDVVVAIGGGSCIDLGKAASALATDPGPVSRLYGENNVSVKPLPVIAIPTTAGTGSEVTPVAVVTDPAARLKIGIASPRIVPVGAICDPKLTVGCPRTVTAYAGIDALVHAVEAFTARRREPEWAHWPGEVFRGKNPISDAFALSAVSAIAASLEPAYRNGDNPSAREQMLYGSLCAGLAFSVAGTAGAHALQYPVGAVTATPHGLGTGLLAPYVLQYCLPACEHELAEIGAALGIRDRKPSIRAQAAIDEIDRLGQAVGLPGSLQELRVAREAINHLALQALTVERLLRNSPRPLDVHALTTILDAAWRGDRLSLRDQGGIA